MIISCQQCATRYHLASRLVKPKGTKVRCSKCRHIFKAFPIAEATVDDSFSSSVDVENVDLDDFEVDPIDKIDADLLAGGFLEETSNEAAPSTVEDVEWNAEETDMPDLADELDKILGTDESEDDSFLDEISEPIVQDAQPSGMDDLELADLEEGLDDLFGGDDDLLDYDDAAVQQITAEELVDDDNPAIQEITAEDLIVSGSEEIEVIDLGELGDDFTDSSIIEASAFKDGIVDLSELDASLDESTDESAITASDSGSADEISLDDLENALDRVEAAEKSRGSELEAETDPDLDLAALLNSEEVPQDNIGQDNIGTDTITLESLTESPSDEVVSVEESAGLDTIQIEDFEFDLDNLEDVSPESSPPEDLSEEADKETDVAFETKEAESADLTSDDGKALVDDDFLESVSENMEGLLPDLDDLDIEDPDIEEPDVGERADEEEALGLDTSEIESFDLELDDLKELASSEDEDADEDDGFSLNTSLIESFDEELENLEALISPDEEAPFEETLTEDGSFSLDPDSIDSDSVDLLDTDPDNLDDLISEKDASQDGEPSDSLESFDFDLENLDELETSEDGAPKADSSGADSDFGLDADQIAALDLEAVDTDAQDLAGDDFMLNLNEVESLDLEMSDIGSSAENTDLESDESVDDINFVLDSDQIESLDLELGSTDIPDAPEEGTKNEKSEQKPVEAEKRRADILNLDLERPDLDEPIDIEDGVDLPILDELLAPAEVFDDTLVENALDLETDATSAGEPESKGNDFDFLDKLGDAPPEDSLPILELDDFDNSVDEKEKEVESATAPVEDDTEEAFVLEKGEPEEQKEPEPITKSIDKGGKAADVKAPMPPGRFQDMPKRRTSRPLLILLAIILLLGLLYGLNAKGIVKVPGLNNVNIPFLDNVLKNDSAKTVDAVGKAQIKTADIKGKFILNKKSGRLFVITGQALNQYDKTRGTIQVRGNVYAAGGKQVASQAALCGNLLPDAELTTKPVTELQSQLSNKAGIGGSGIPTVGPGKTVPFMIVFSGLPTDIEEFSIEVVGSTAS